MTKSGNLLNLPTEILIKIIKFAENDKHLSLTCFKFYELVKKVNEQNVSLSVDYRYLLNPTLDLDNFLNSSSTISLYINDNCSNLKNFDEKLQFFLQIYGHKVKKLIFNAKFKIYASKFLHLLPNLEEVQLMKPMSFENLNKEKCSIPLRKLRIFRENDLKSLEIFDAKELEINNDYFNNVQQNVDFIRNNRNLEKLTICYFTNINLSLALSSIKLKTLEILCCQWSDEDLLGNCLQNQIFLKELSIDEVSGRVFTIICKNLKKLEKLNFQFCDCRPLAALRQLSDLKNLKSLSIRNYLDENNFDDFTKAKYENLEILDTALSFRVNLPKRIEILSESCRNLKTLTLFFIWKIPVKVISKILEKFNNLENLSLSFVADIHFSKSEEIFFYTQKHENKNLKSLQFEKKNFHFENLIAKFARDFPNLEVIDFDEIIEDKKIFKLLLYNFKNLRKIENLTINNEELMKIYLKHGRNLTEFHLNLNMMDQPNEILKDCSLSIVDMECSNKITRTKEIKTDLEFTNYAFWKTFKTTLDSTKDIKNLSIYTVRDSKVNDKIVLKSLKNFREFIVKLTFFYNFTERQLRSFLKAFPNCQVVTFALNNYSSQVLGTFNLIRRISNDLYDMP